MELHGWCERATTGRLGWGFFFWVWRFMGTEPEEVEFEAQRSSAGGRIFAWDFFVLGC